VSLNGIPLSASLSLIDYGGQAFIYMEGKLENAEFIEGQKRALMAVVLSHWQAGHPAMALVYEHNVPIAEDIPVGWMPVKGVFCLKQIPLLMRVPFRDGVPLYPIKETWFHTHDSGKLRDPKKEHWDDCVWNNAKILLSKSKEL
jgi:hypothetical protein